MLIDFLFPWRRQLDRIEFILNQLLKGQTKMAQELEDLKAAVSNITDVTTAAVAAFKGISAKLDAAIASGNPAELKALSATLKADAQALGDAIVANTPAENV